MKTRYAMRLTLAKVSLLALLCATGIVGMLLVEGSWDAGFLALTALPLVIGGWRAFRYREVGARMRRHI